MPLPVRSSARMSKKAKWSAATPLTRDEARRIAVNVNRPLVSLVGRCNQAGG